MAVPDFAFALRLIWCGLICFAPVHGRDNSETRTTAQTIGVLPQVLELERLNTNPAGSSQQILSLRQQISEEVLATSLEVDAAVAQIDNEIARANEVRSFLADRRDHIVNRDNLLSVIIGGGLSAASAALQLAAKQTKPSAVVGIGGGVISSGLAIAGIRAQKGQTRIFDFDSNMLAQLFDKPALADSSYAPVVWEFLKEVAPTDEDHISRKARLIKTWITLKRIDFPDTASGKNKIDRVTSQPSAQMRLTIDDLEDRAAMLGDVRAKISFFKRDLAALLMSLPGHSRS